ncbi:hypothetical protein D3C80_544350 [compost metagenome]
MVNASRAKAPLGNLETTPLTQQHVLVRHSHVLEQHFGMAMGSVVVTEHRQWPDDFHPGGIGGHQNHRMLLVTRAVRVAQPHEDHDLAARIAGTGGPPLAAIDHPLVALADSAGGHVGGIGRRHIRLGHGKG